jgi:hypothetical protein
VFTHEREEGRNKRRDEGCIKEGGDLYLADKVLVVRHPKIRASGTRRAADVLSIEEGTTVHIRRRHGYHVTEGCVG